MEDINDKYISLVAHDAGAASHILAWIKSGMLRIDKCKFCFKGPAAKLLKVQLPNIELLSLEDVLVDTETLLSGTGWASSLEYNARLIAKKYKLLVLEDCATALGAKINNKGWCMCRCLFYSFF